MKTKLLLLLSTITFYTYSQTPIEDFNSVPSSTYAIVTGAITQDNSGATSWDFSLTPTAITSIDTYDAIAMGSTVETTYPGTTSALTTTASVDPPGTGKLYTKNDTNVISITGAENSGLVLNYADNGLIGTFPLNFNDTNGTDTVSGTFNFDGNSGDFDGTLTTTVDAHGTLTMSDVGSGAYSGNVTRLKIEQSLNLSITIGIPINVGTATQTSYFYYDSTNANLVFRSTELVIDVDIPSLVSINETITTMESLLSSTLGTSENKISNRSLSLFPNPVKDDLNFNLSNDLVISSITVSDISGRQVLKMKTNERTMPVEQLNKGIYIATITTNQGILSRKFVKE